MTRQEVTETFAVVDGLPLRLAFSATAIREHFDGDPAYGDKVAGLSDEELERLGAAALTDDVLYEAFHDALVAYLKNTTTPAEAAASHAPVGWWLRGAYPRCRCGYAPHDNGLLNAHWAEYGLVWYDDHGQLKYREVTND